jgi:hypothetical protein
MEYAPWEGEWEEHHPRAGLEYEYDWLEATGEWVLEDVETEQYEYEPGEGYHEQEWYDPSDWLELGRDFEREADWLGGAYRAPTGMPEPEGWARDAYGPYDPDAAYHTDEPWVDTW